jgi:hypothetical protein
MELSVLVFIFVVDVFFHLLFGLLWVRKPFPSQSAYTGQY